MDGFEAGGLPSGVEEPVADTCVWETFSDSFKRFKTVWNLLLLAASWLHQLHINKGNKTWTYQLIFCKFIRSKSVDWDISNKCSFTICLPENVPQKRTGWEFRIFWHVSKLLLHSCIGPPRNLEHIQQIEAELSVRALQQTQAVWSRWSGRNHFWLRGISVPDVGFSPLTQP